MTHYARTSAIWNSSKCLEVSSTKGQGRARLPTHDLIEQVTTYTDKTKYLIRVYVRLGSPITLYPFQITEIVSITSNKQLRWRFPAGSVKLTAISTVDNFRDCDSCIKRWAAAFLNSRRPFSPTASSSEDQS